jgi:hypothetical protein
MSNVFCIGNGTSRKNFNLEKLRPYGKIYGCNAIYRTFTPDVLTAVDHGIMHEIYHSNYCEKNITYFRDWNKLPAEIYESMIYSGLTKEEKSFLQNFDVVTTNERTNQKEFVMHGSNLKGLVSVLHKDIAKGTQKIEKRNINHNSLCVSWVRNNDYTFDLREIMKNEQNTPVDHGWSAGPTSGYISIKREKPKNVYLIGHDLYSNDNKVNNLYAGSKHYVIPEHSPTPCVNWIDQWRTLFKWNSDTNFIKVNEFNDDRDKTNAAISEWHGIKNIKYMNFFQLDLLFGL